MRAALLVALLALAARAQGPAPRTRLAKDPGGRIEITVPESWQDADPGEGEVMRLNAPHGGGHQLIVVREAAQAEVDKQRDRYMEHDAAKYPGSEFQKIADPFFGYRMNDPAKNRVLLRAFLRDGADGLVVTISSRFQAYDAYAATTIAALASVKLSGAAPAAAPAATEGGAGGRRIFDRAARFSFVAPAVWKVMTPEEGEALALGLKGTSQTATMRVVDEGEMDNPTLLLLTIQGRWKKDYAACSAERVGTTPPALLVRNRKEGWVDYVIAFASGGRGYTFRLAAREGSFDALQKDADAMAASLVVMGDPYRAPAQVPGDLVRESKKGHVVHAAGGQEAAVDATLDAMGAFERDWGKISPAPARKGAPLHVVLVAGDAFADASHGFGDAPAAYDRLACAVVLVAPPEGKDAIVTWRGRLYAALAEASLHRDLPVATPPWLLAGLSACMEAAGRTGEGPAARHFALVTPLDVERPAALADVLAYNYADVIQGETITPLAMSWGYTHLMLFGKGQLRAAYAKWARELSKATKSAPRLEVGKSAEAEAELKKHVERELRK